MSLAGRAPWPTGAPSALASDHHSPHCHLCQELALSSPPNPHLLSEGDTKIMGIRGPHSGVVQNKARPPPPCRETPAKQKSEALTTSHSQTSTVPGNCGILASLLRTQSFTGLFLGLLGQHLGILLSHSLMVNGHVSLHCDQMRTLRPQLTRV